MRESIMSVTTRPRSFGEFYSFYLSQHRNPICRGLHYAGSSLFLIILIWSLYSASYIAIPGGVVLGYAFAWVGHYFFEHNKPATFQYPLWSLMGDWVMLKDFLSGKFRR